MIDYNQIANKPNCAMISQSKGKRDNICSMSDDFSIECESENGQGSTKIYFKMDCTPKRKSGRRIKDVHQLITLEKFFALDPTWSKKTISYIQEFMGLTRLQLYKWGYDQKRKSSCKNGIRSKRRDRCTKRMGSSNSLDYNIMVDDLLQELGSPNEGNKIDFEKFALLKKSYLTQKSNFEEVHLMTNDETPISIQDDDEQSKLDRVELLLSDENSVKQDQYETLVADLKQLPSLREVARHEIGDFRYFA